MSIRTVEEMPDRAIRSISRRRRGGNALLELGLILLPLCALLFGLLDVVMVIFLQSTFQNAVRQGVRFAVTFSPTYGATSCTTQTVCITQAVQDASAGFLGGTAGAAYIHVDYYTPANLNTPVTAANLPLTLASGTVVNYVNQTGNVVEVRVTGYPWVWMAPIQGFTTGTGLTLSAAASDVLQGYAVGNTAPPTP
jgi:Flp pilus assembly protein TadG